MTRLYLSGPIKGRENAEQNFKTNQLLLISHSYEVVNPFDCAPLHWNCDPDSGVHADHYDCFIRGDIAQMMTCHGLAYMPGWSDSKGAMLEISTARAVGLPVRSVLAWALEATS